MADQEKTQKQFKVVFNGTKNEEIATAGSKYAKFVNNIIRPYANVIKYYYLIYLIYIDSIIKKRFSTRENS